MNATATVQCPSCAKVGTSSRPIPPGTKVKCSKCGHAFRAGEIETIDLDVPLIATPQTAPSTTPQPIPQTAPSTTPQPTPEPRYFVALVVLGWIIVGLGACQLAWTLHLNVAFVLNTSDRLKRGSEMSLAMNEAGAAVLRGMLLTSALAMVASLTVGMLVWLAVDVARSVRKIA